MIKLTFPDGSIKEYENNIRGIDVVKQISSSLAKKTIACKVNGELTDLFKEINNDSTIVFITNESSEAFEILNHSTAHLLAHAVSLLYPNAQMGVGPAIEEGFYYDFDLGDIKLTNEDLPKIEKKMMEISNKDYKLEYSIVSKEEAKELMKNDKYKLELIDAINDEFVNLYKEDDYYEICRGPHMSSTKKIRNFKLLSLAGAYWRGDSNNKMLTRIYGTSWFSDEDLKKHLEILENRKLRDHKKIGKELDLFMISDYGPGLPFWLPNGYVLRRTLEDFWLDIHKKNGYLTINTPIMLNRELWETSGHWDHYKEDMFTIDVEDGTYAVKPMNCPGAILVYKNDLHSYKEFPLRYSELGNVHRYEASGALNGLFRVRGFTQDDAHTFIKEDQIKDEVSRIIALYDEIYSIFGLDYNIELSTRPVDNYIGSIEIWDEAEEALKNACLATNHNFKINPGDGAFYGPKLDFKLRDSMNRIWQCGTVQLDMQLPGRFDCTYIAEDGTKKTPVMIHRACFGSIERFIGIITENFGGNFPTWLHPVQVKIIPVSLTAHMEYSKKLLNILQDNNLRVELDQREEKLGYKIREAQKKHIPYQLVIGDNEIENNTVTYRMRGKNEQVTVSINEFIEMIQKEIKTKKY